MRARHQLLSTVYDDVLVLFITATDLKCPLRGATLRHEGTVTQQTIATIEDFVKAQDIGLCYFSYDQLSFLTDYLPCKTAVEIHDVIHLRQAQFEKFGYSAPYETTKEDELKSLAKYDYVFSLNLNEVRYLHDNGVAQALYLPPNIAFTAIAPPKDDSSFGLIASMSKPNLDGFNRISGLIQSASDFVLAGPMALDPEISAQLHPSALNLGVVGNPREFYERIKIAISPIRFGGGLKIKVFEALSYGRPVLATQHSIDGFPPGIEDVVTVVDDLDSWDANVVTEALGKSSALAEQYFWEHFSGERCSRVLQEAF